MKNIELKYLQFFQHTAVCMRQLCLKSSNYIHIDTELNIISSLQKAKLQLNSTLSIPNKSDRKSSDQNVRLTAY